MEKHKQIYDNYNCHHDQINYIFIFQIFNVVRVAIINNKIKP